MKEFIVKLIAKETNLKPKEIENLIELPPSDKLGDYAIPCFILSEKLKKSPLIIAEDLAKKLRKNLPKEISNVDFKGPYVNFFMDKKILAEDVLTKVKKKDFGKNNLGKKKVICIDMSSPNIAKPFGIGHLRSTIIGNSIGEICKANGYKVIKINYLGDWGTQFGKIILGFKKWGNEKKLMKNPVAHLYELYVKANDKKFDAASRDEFKKLENGDTENLKLWKRFRELSLKKFEEIYNLLEVKFDVISSESIHNKKLDSIISELKKKKLTKKDDGAMIVDLKNEGLGIALIQKSDGTSLYATRDLAAVKNRKEKYKFDRMIYEVGQEQKLHFRQVFRILEKMGHAWSKDCVHVAHGLYLDSDGKKFATRKGKTIFMEEILNEVIEKAKKNLSEREDLSKKELVKRAKKIALAAIYYGDLKNSRENNMIFDVDKFLSFEGDTGPYLLYSYARASSIIRKVKSKKTVKIVDLKNTEIKLLKKVNSFEEVITNAYKQLAPNLIANYSFELSQIFNEFYHDCPVLGSIEEGFRLKLVDAFRTTLKKSLDLLGIDVLEEM
ncbi:arginine--tRNA ligase [Candidatus Pacearchaeota archaeon]|nr:arginine--tRNA ligase [Candidatus Pacearchaeota archaeon]